MVVRATMLESSLTPSVSISLGKRFTRTLTPQRDPSPESPHFGSFRIRFVLINQLDLWWFQSSGVYGEQVWGVRIGESSCLRPQSPEPSLERGGQSVRPTLSMTSKRWRKTSSHFTPIITLIDVTDTLKLLNYLSFTNFSTDRVPFLSYLETRII